MPIAVMLVGLIVQALGASSLRQQDVERRTEALTHGQIGLERMTRELRQAEWVFFRSSAIVDLEAPVRATPTSSAVARLVRYDCSRSTCLRSEGPATAYPPPAAPTFERSTIAIGAPSAEAAGRYGRVTSHDVFLPLRVDPSTGAAVPDYVDPHMLQVRIRLTVKDRPSPIVLFDGVALRNRSMP